MPSVYRRIYRPHKGHGRLDDDNRERCKALLAQGKTNTEIVAETGVSVAQLTRYRKNIRESGAIIPPRRKKPGPPMKPDGLRMKRKLRELEKVIIYFLLQVPSFPCTTITPAEMVRSTSFCIYRLD